jgi:adenylate cyclase
VDRLESKKDEFLKTYGVIPKFKAGISLGRVTVAEVGELKTEIAYHGDVLNTTARIEGYCNTFSKALLASESLVKALENSSQQFSFQYLAEVELRGKEGTYAIYSCEKKRSCFDFSPYFYL